MDSALVILLGILIFAGLFILVADAIIKNRFTLPLPDEKQDININIDNSREEEDIKKEPPDNLYYKDMVENLRKQIEELHKKQSEPIIKVGVDPVEKPVEPVEKEKPKEPTPKVEGLPSDPKDDTYEVLCRYLQNIYFRMREPGQEERDKALVHNVILRIKSLNNQVTQKRILESGNFAEEPQTKRHEPRPIM